MSLPLAYSSSGIRISLLNPVANSPSLPSASASMSASVGGNKRHACPRCGKTFSTSGHLTRHSKVHTGERSHPCPFPACDKRCSRHDNLVQHFRIHVAKSDREKGSGFIRSVMEDMLAKPRATFGYPAIRSQSVSSTGDDFTPSSGEEDVLPPQPMLDARDEPYSSQTTPSISPPLRLEDVRGSNPPGRSDGECEPGSQFFEPTPSFRFLPTTFTPEMLSSMPVTPPPSSSRIPADKSAANLYFLAGISSSIASGLHLSPSSTSLSTRFSSNDGRGFDVSYARTDAD